MVADQQLAMTSFLQDQERELFVNQVDHYNPHVDNRVSSSDNYNSVCPIVCQAAELGGQGREGEMGGHEGRRASSHTLDDSHGLVGLVLRQEKPGKWRRPARTPPWRRTAWPNPVSLCSEKTCGLPRKSPKSWLTD